MEKRPTWTPAWLWAEYLAWVARIQAIPASPTGVALKPFFEEKLKIAHTIVHDNECRIVWPALRRRSKQFDKRQAEIKTDTPYVSTIVSSQFDDLMSSVAAAKQGPIAYELVPSQERKERGSRIARLAKELRIELEKCSLPDFGPPHEIGGHVSTMAKRVASRNIEQQSHYRARNNKGLFKDLRGEEVEMVSAIIEAILGEGDPKRITTFPALFAIEAGAIEWSKSKPITHRPNDPNVHCLYFIRALTQHFVEYYDTALLQQTAVIANAIFDCNLDASRIKKLLR